MIAVDTNLLIYAHRQEMPFHAVASDRIAELAEGRAPWAIPMHCIHEFTASVTHPRVWGQNASTLAQVTNQLQIWMESPTLRILHTGAKHIEIFLDLLTKSKAVGGQIHDARIAATCIENGVDVLWSADRDFGKFKQLKTVNPLVD